jgi:hypothetical protein
MAALQDQMKATLETLGIPAKEVKCYGSQIMITCWGEPAARKFAHVLNRFCSKVTGPKESIDYNQVNEGTCLRPTTHKVWLVWGTI